MGTTTATFKACTRRLILLKLNQLIHRNRSQKIKKSSDNLRKKKKKKKRRRRRRIMKPGLRPPPLSGVDPAYSTAPFALLLSSGGASATCYPRLIPKCSPRPSPRLC